MSARTPRIVSTLSLWTEQEREVMTRRFRDGLTATEAGGLMGLTLDQIKKITKAAKAKCLVAHQHGGIVLEF